MNFDSVIAFGGSTVGGLELGPVKGSTYHELAFPQLVADYFKVPCYNYSWPGASNDRTSRLLPEKVLAHPNSLVLISWVDFSRSEFFYPHCDSVVPADPSGYIQLYINLSEFLPKGSSHFVTETNDFFYKNIFWDPNHHNNYRHYNSLLQAQLICKKFSNCYIQIFELPNIILEYNINQRIILENIDFDHVLKFSLQNHSYTVEGWNYGYGNLYDWSRFNQFPIGKYHVLHESHRALADLIIDHIKNENTTGRR